MPESPSLRQALRQRRREKLGTIIPNEIILEELRRFLDEHFPAAHRHDAVLDVGAGTRPYATLYEPRFAIAVSNDVEDSLHDVAGVSVFASAQDLPFPDRAFDCVICTEVLEHCAEPAAVLVEIRRVLRPGGRAFLSTPFLVGLHEMPHDYYRFTPSALSELAARAGLDVIALEPRGDYTAVLLGFLLLPWSKAWLRLSRWLAIDLFRPANPVVALTVVAPQMMYVWLWRRMRDRPAGGLRRAYDRTSYTTLGYVTHLLRPEER